MNGFKERGLDEDAFSEKGKAIVAAFDAFPKSKPQYITRTTTGGKWTVAMLSVSFLLILTEIARWWRGHETHTFAVEKGVSHDLQINIDMVVAMRCPDLHVNVQDAAGDWIRAGEVLKKDPTNWAQWVNSKGQHKLGRDSEGRLLSGEGWQLSSEEEGFGEEHVHDIVRSAGKRAKWAKTPKIRGMPKEGDSCRVFGSMQLNKVQGDFHITARGHGYHEFTVPGHLEHDAFNFSHIITEFSFGPFYPSLINPLDSTISVTPSHFHKFQYFLSVVPTIYTVSSSASTALSILTGKSTIITNQYAVTEQDLSIGERAIPGIFWKYDIEPLLLIVEESRDGFLRFCVKVVNILSGVLVAGHWGYRLTEWAVEVLGRKRRERSQGVLTGKAGEE